MDKPAQIEFRKNIRSLWLSSLSALADIDLQQRWLNRKITNPVWSFVEFMCSYFDDICLLYGGYDRMIEDGIITRDEYECIKDFHSALDEYEPPNGYYDPEAILADLKWLSIVALGKKDMEKLATILPDSEKEILFQKAAPLTDEDFTWPN